MNAILAGVGGQGVVTAGMLMGDAARIGGLNAVMSEIHGLAQRGGSVVVDLRIGNVYGPIIPEGAADVIIGFEALEGLRALRRASSEVTLILSMERITPSTVNVGEAKYPDVQRLVSRAREQGVTVYEVDALTIARAIGSPLSTNVVLVGATYGAGLLPVGLEHIRRALEERFSSHALEANLRALEAGMEEVKVQREATGL